MPLEIRELVIKVTADQPQGTEGAPVAPGKEGEEKEALLRHCIEEVLRIMNAKNER
jgi:hypothetical protein